MSAGASVKRLPIRAIGLAILGLLVGVAGWLPTLYATAAVLSGWRVNLAFAQAVWVAVEVTVIAGLVIGAIRAREARPFLVGAAVSFATITVLYWTSMMSRLP